MNLNLADLLFNRFISKQSLAIYAMLRLVVESSRIKFTNYPLDRWAESLTILLYNFFGAVMKDQRSVKVTKSQATRGATIAWCNEYNLKNRPKDDDRISPPMQMEEISG